MIDIPTVVACAVGGGFFGALFAHLTRARPRRHRGEHRPIWRRGPRTDPYTPTDVPLQGLDLTDGDAPTQKIPLPRGGVDHS